MTNFLKGACAALGVFALLQPNACAALTIELRAQAVAAHADVTLADVAVGALPPALAQAALGRSPLQGQVLYLDSEAIERALRRRAGVSAPIEWRGSRRVAVRRAGRVVPAQVLVDTAAAAARARFAGEHLEFAVAGRVADTQVPAGEVRIVARGLEGHGARARVPVWLDIEVDGRHARSVLVALAGTRRQGAMVALRSLPAGARVSAADVAVREVNAAGVDALALDALRPDVRLRRALRAGEVLSAAALAPDGTVARGDQVVLQVRSGPISIDAPAVALGSAEPGQLLAVRPLHAAAIVKGRLRHGAVVEVE